MVQRGERAAIQQVRFYVPKWPFDLTFRFRTTGPASPGLKPVMRCERKKARVVDGLVAVVTRHDHLHVVVETGGREALKVLESVHVFADGGCKILRLHKAQILPARVTQNITESMHSPLA